MKIGEKKILFIIDTLEVGGAEKSLLTFLSSPHPFESVVCHIYKGHSLREQFVKNKVRVISLDLQGPYNFRLAIKSVNEVIAKEKPDLIHATLLRSDLIMRWCAYRANIPLVVHLVGDSFNKSRWGSNSFTWRIKNFIFYLINRLTKGRVRLFIAVTHLIKENFARAMSLQPSKIQVVYRGRSIDLISEGSVPLSKSNISLISVGRLTRSKGQHLLIEVFPMLTKQFAKSFDLQIVGDGPEYNNLLSKIETSGLNDSVKLLGFRTDIPQLLQNSDIFLFPSMYEGAAGAVIEAMLAGKPVILSDIEAFREYVTHGENGLLFKAGDANALVECISYLINNPDAAVRLGKSARAYAIENFDIEKRNIELRKVLMNITK